MNSANALFELSGITERYYMQLCKLGKRIRRDGLHRLNVYDIDGTVAAHRNVKRGVPKVVRVPEGPYIFLSARATENICFTKEWTDINNFTPIAIIHRDIRIWPRTCDMISLYKLTVLNILKYMAPDVGMTFFDDDAGIVAAVRRHGHANAVLMQRL